MRFKLFSLIGPALHGFSEEDREAFSERVVAISEAPQWWTDYAQGRFSIVSAERDVHSYIYGVLTQEYFLEQHLYDDRKRESRDAIPSYEDRFFILDLDRNLLALEWRQFRRKPPLKSSLLVSRAARMMRDLVGPFMENGAVRLEPFHQETTKEQFVGLFYGYRVLALEVMNVGEAPIDPEIQLVNPGEHLEGAARELMQHDHDLAGLRRVTFEAEDEEVSDLRRSAIARSALHSGRPRSIKFQRPSGYIQVRRESEDGLIEARIPVSPTDSLEKRSIAARQLIEEMRGLDISELELASPPDTAQISLNFDEDEAA